MDMTPFASCPDRNATGSEKWDRWEGKDIIPLWVADMDFRTPDVVLDAIHQHVNHGVFGYSHIPPGFVAAFATHLKRLHGWTIDPTHVTSMPGVVNGLAASARLLANEGDDIATFTPVYPPFINLPGLAGRNLVRVALRDAGTTWAIDWDALEKAITPRCRAFWLCHPHNPTGTVFTRTDLERLADVAERHNLTVVSDEIWSDLVLDNAGHIPFASLDHPAARRAITLHAPSKTWNLAGLGCAVAIIPDPDIRRRWRSVGGGMVPMLNPLGYTAAKAAWLQGDTWRRSLITLLEHHRDLVLRTVSRIPGLRCIPPQATYLMWIDCRDSGIADPQAACEAAGVGPSDGRDFGAPGFIRLNTACPTARLEEGLRRLEKAFTRST